MDKLFASFQRLDQEKNRSIEGTELGMSIVQRLLDMMGSELKVSSVYGSGSTFSFEIEQKIVKAEPIGDFEQRFKAAAEHTSETVIRIAPKARVLVVDDNETNLLVAQSVVKLYPHKYRQYRIIIVVRPRRQIFHQIVQKFRRHTNVCQEISVQYGGKYARGRAAKAAAVNCEVLPIFFVSVSRQILSPSAYCNVLTRTA